MLERAPTHGLRAGDYLMELFAPARVDRARADDDLDTLARADVALTFKTMRYIKDVVLGRFSPGELRLGLDPTPREIDLGETLGAVLQAADPKAHLDALAPALSQYQALRRSLSHYRQLARNEGGEEIVLSAPLRPGERHPAVPVLRRRLVLTGDLFAATTSFGEYYDPQLVNAVANFQERHGLTPDGIVGERTLRELATPWADRVLQIVAAMERLRWVPDRLEGKVIVVNVPQYRLYGLHGDGHDYRVAFESAVIVGRRYRRYRTPIFSDVLRYVEFRPYWNIPPSIVRLEMAPHLDEPDYLTANDLEIVQRFGDDATPLPPTPAHVEGVRAGELKLRQRPGPENALGLVKFIFPNVYSVYLHATPAMGLFERNERDFSHGCVRVADAAGLAAWILEGRPGWDRERIEGAMRAGGPTRVGVAPIPVYILYLTAFVDRTTGETHFRNDIYGHDALLAEKLGASFRAMDGVLDRWR